MKSKRLESVIEMMVILIIRKLIPAAADINQNT